MIVEFKIDDASWIDKNTDDNEDYDPNFCLDEITSQMYRFIVIYDKRE